MRLQIEVADVTAEILQHLLLARVVRILGGHGEVGVLGQRLRGDQMRRAIDAAIGPAVIPVAADAVLTLENVEREVAAAEFFATVMPEEPAPMTQ